MKRTPEVGERVGLAHSLCLKWAPSVERLRFLRALRGTVAAIERGISGEPLVVVDFRAYGRLAYRARDLRRVQP